MPGNLGRRDSGILLVAAGLAAGWLLQPLLGGAEPVAGPIASAVIPWEKAKPLVAKWGELRTYFTGETLGTTDLLTAVVVLKPGEAVHQAHRHAEEEFIVLTEGAGRWHLDGKEFPAAKGDVLYAAPWVFHGLVNTGAQPLTFFVSKWNNKGVKAPPAPEGAHEK